MSVCKQSHSGWANEAYRRLIPGPFGRDIVTNTKLEVTVTNGAPTQGGASATCRGGSKRVTERVQEETATGGILSLHSRDRIRSTPLESESIPVISDPVG